MTEAEETKYNKERDDVYMNAADAVWKGEAKGFGSRYRHLQETGLYNGTSFQRKYYPKHYRTHIESLKSNSKAP